MFLCLPDSLGQPSNMHSLYFYLLVFVTFYSIGLFAMFIEFLFIIILSSFIFTLETCSLSIFFKAPCNYLSLLSLLRKKITISHGTKLSFIMRPRDICDECQAKIDLFEVKKIGKFLVFKIV